MEVKKSSYSNTSSKVKDIVQIGLLSALTFVAAMAIHIPYGNGGVLHLGDSMIFLTAVLFGRKYAAISAALGMTMFDILSGYSAWAPYTLVIKAVMGFMAGSIAYSGNAEGKSIIKNITAMLLAGIWMIIGYYIAEGIITGNWIAPIVGASGNTVQLGASAVIALVITAAIKRTNYFKK
jgi:uncharacterized membrane protein